VKRQKVDGRAYFSDDIVGTRKTRYYCNHLSEFKEIYIQKSNMKKLEKSMLHFIAFIPCVAIYFLVFSKKFQIVGFKVLIISLLYALINGILEEIFGVEFLIKCLIKIFYWHTYIRPYFLVFGIYHYILQKEWYIKVAFPH